MAKQIKSTFRSYSDTQHGWIAVKRDFLKKLGIFNQITRYSYQKGQTVYLEEDQDAATFINAFEKAFGFKPSLAHNYVNTSSVIRSYEPFTVGQLDGYYVDE